MHQTIEKDLQQRRTFSRPDSSGGDRRAENRVGTNHSEPKTMKETLMATGRNVLIVEDDRDFVNALKTVFESRNYQVRCAYDGQAGFAEIQQQKPDALVLDVMMSTLTEGFDLAFHLKSKAEFRDIPIVMVTGFPHEMTTLGPEKFQNALREDWPAAKILEKPVDPEQVLGAVESLLQ